jgi:hypothetical protein
MMRYSLFLATLIVSACSELKPDAIVRQSEENLVLPRGAESITSYNRFYVISETSAKGVLIFSPSGKGSFKVVATEKDLPFVADGGCDVIEVQLDLQSMEWDRPLCHGP